jgi:hypothetical protein
MIEFHPLANIFPLIQAAEFEAFVDDVREHGLADKIVMHEDKIVDGRNRYRALVKIGLTDEEILRCHTEPLDDGVDPLTFVISKNLKRRHLDESQRAMVAARLATLTHGGDRVSEQAANLPVATQAEAATLLNVSERSVRSATVIRDRGAAELVAAVDRGDVSVSAAAEIATQPVEQQRELVARGEKQILTAAGKIRAEKRERKNAKARAADAGPTETPQIPPADDATSLKPLAEVPQPLETTVLGIETDFGSLNRGIDILYSRWTELARGAIENAQDVRMIKNIRDKAAGLEMQSHLAKNAEAARQARVIRFWAERSLGRWLIDAEKKGHRHMGRPPKGVKIGKQDPGLITLGKLGISRKESHDCQRVARMTDRKFAALLEGKAGRRRLPHRRRVRRFRPAA